MPTTTRAQIRRDKGQVAHHARSRQRSHDELCSLWAQREAWQRHQSDGRTGHYARFVRA